MGGTAADTIILTPAFSAPPMRCPDDVWAMCVSAVDIANDIDPEYTGTVRLFAGWWVGDRPPGDGAYSGDLALRLEPPADQTRRCDEVADIEMLLAYNGQWRRVGYWRGIDNRWPDVIAPTADVAMRLYRDLTETDEWEPTPPPTGTRPRMKWARGGIGELLDAGLVTAGDELIWHCRHHGIRHTATILSDGALVLADGRVYANLTGATNALGGIQQNGWDAFRCTSDGRTLADLRTERRARRAQ